MASKNCTIASLILTEPSSKKRKISVNGEDIEGATKISSQSKKNQDSTNSSEREWSEEDMEMLVETVLKEVGEEGLERNHSLVLKHLDWEKISVAGFSAEQCKERWTELEKKVRKYRTASEIITDTREAIKNFKAPTGLTDKPPKKPMPPPFAYLSKHRESFKRTHPDVPIKDIQKTLCEQYNQLSDKKKRKYIEKYNTELAGWKIQHEEYLEKHPDKRVKVGKKKPKLWTPLQLYLKDMLQKHSSDAGDSEEGKRLSEKYRGKWSDGLSESRKVKYIRKALLLHKTYKEEMEQYCQKNGTTLSHERSVLTKAEQKLKDKFDGKPENPPQSGFMMFVKDITPQLSDIPVTSRIAEASKRFNSLSDTEQAEWKQRRNQLYDEYLVKLSSYVQSLPQEERAPYEVILKKGNKSKAKKGEDKLAVKCVKEENVEVDESD